MTMENKFARFMRNTGPSRMLVSIGLLLIVFGMILLSFRTGNFVQTTGRITSVVENTDIENQKGFDVGVTYLANGAEYESRFVNLSGSFSEGADIAVYYNPENPEQIINSKTSPLIAPILIVLGVLAMGLGIFHTTKANKKSKEQSDRQEGIRQRGFR